MYGLPTPSAGEIGAMSPAVGDFVVYEGSLDKAWGRYRVVAITEHNPGSRYDLSPYRDDSVVLRGVSRRSIAVIPAGPAHRVDNPVERIDAVLRRRVGLVGATDIAHVDKLPSTMLTLLALNRHVEAETYLLRAEHATEILSTAAFRHRIEQLRIRGNDESYLTQDFCMPATTPETDHGTSPGSPVQ
jgi:hypothetical protein